jgi:hypothetical protein
MLASPAALDTLLRSDAALLILQPGPPSPAPGLPCVQLDPMPVFDLLYPQLHMSWSSPTCRRRLFGSLHRETIGA